MRYLLKEFLYVVAAICGIYSTFYVLTAEDWKCQMWALLGAALATYIGYKAHKIIMRRKNKELSKMAVRSKALEEMVLGKNRLSSGYDPDKHL